MARVCATDVTTQWRTCCIVTCIMLSPVAPSPSTTQLAVNKEMPQSSCTVQFASGSQPCKIFESSPDCCSAAFVEEDFSIVFHNISIRHPSRGIAPYREALATIFPNSPRLLDNQLLLQLRSYNSDRRPFCWLIHLIEARDSPSSFHKIHVDMYLPEEATPAQWIATTVDYSRCGKSLTEVNATHPRNDVGDRDSSDPLCSSLYMAEHSMQVFGTRKELKLSLTMNESTPLVVRLMSGQCEVNCSGVTNDCDVNVTKDTWENTSEPWRHQVTIGYHCLRIELPELQSCVIYTHTEMLRGVPSSLPTELPVSINQVLLFSVTGLLVCFFIFVTTYISVNTCKGRLSGGHEFDTSKINSAEKQNQVSLLPPEILLLYSRDSITFCHAVRALRVLLEKYLQIKVYDPFEDVQMELISRNREGWLKNLLYSPTLRVVFVHSEGALLRQNAMDSNSVVVFKHPHFVDAIFTSALSQLQQNETLGHDYQRIFSVRFEEFGSSRTNQTVTPYRCFTLLNNFDKFVAAIYGYVSVDHVTIADTEQTCCQEIEHLRMAIEDLRRVCGEKKPSCLRAHSASSLPR